MSAIFVSTFALYGAFSAGAIFGTVLAALLCSARDE